MVVTTSTDGQNSNFNFSKWWPFRLINIISLISLVSLFTILLIPIPYLDKERKPTIVNYSFNSYPFSHAIRVKQTNLGDNLTSITLSTYNSDHIIGTVTFGDFSLDYDGKYLYRFINVHYIKDRRDFPIRLVFVDIYPDRFHYKKFTLYNLESQEYHLADSTVYVITDSEIPARQVNVSLPDLFNSAPKGIYYTAYLDQDYKLVTEYFAGKLAMISTVTIGNIEVPLLPETENRTITTILNPSLNIAKVVISSVFEGNSPPVYKAFYYSQSDSTFYENIDALNSAKDLNITDNAFKIKKFETPKTVGVQYDTNRDKLLKLEFENIKFKYDIYLTHEKESIITFLEDSKREIPKNQGEPVLDRMLVAKYKRRHGKTHASYYLFDRMLHYNKRRSLQL